MKEALTSISSFFPPWRVRSVPLNRKIEQSLGSSQPESSVIERSVTSKFSESSRAVSPADRANGASSSALTGSWARARPPATRARTSRTGTNAFCFMTLPPTPVGLAGGASGSRSGGLPDLPEQPREVTAEDLLDPRLGVTPLPQQGGQGLEAARRVEVGQEGVDVLRFARRGDPLAAPLLNVLAVPLDEFGRQF